MGFTPLKNAAQLNEIKSGLYIFEDAMNGGLTYVGQSKNIMTRLGQHGKRVTEGTVWVKPMQGSKPIAREVQETIVINKLGGLDDLANQRLPVSKIRNVEKALGITNYVD